MDYRGKVVIVTGASSGIGYVTAGAFARRGATVVVASHNLALIEELNRRTLVLDHGRIIGDFARPRG